MNINMLDFLMENDVVIFCSDTGYGITADSAYVFGGEFVVYDHLSSNQQKDLYRGLDFEKAMRVLEGKDE